MGKYRVDCSCNMTKIQLFCLIYEDIGANLSLARKVKRSESVLIQTKNDIDCEASKSTSFRWEVYSISRDPKEFQQLSPEELVRTGDQPYIQISATSLYFGFYKLVFTVKMNDVIGIFGSAEGFIHVVATQDSLLPAIDGGPRKRFKFGSVVSCFTLMKLQLFFSNGKFIFLTNVSPGLGWRGGLVGGEPVSLATEKYRLLKHTFLL